MVRQRGFTLIELMVVIVILSILTAIAIPAYSDYVRRGALPEAFSTLSGHRVKMEQFFQDNRTYEDACEDGTVATTPAATERFTFACESDATTYTITATGNDDTTVAGFEFTVDQSNARDTTSVPDGWTDADGCWVVRKDGSC